MASPPILFVGQQDHGEMSGRKTGWSAASWLILIGGILSALSANLVWSKADAASLAAGIPAVNVNDALLYRRGFDLYLGWINLGWAAATCGIAASSLLLWNALESTSSVSGLQTALGAAIMAVAVLHISSFPGVWTALFGGGLIVAGARMGSARKRSQ